MIRENFSFTLLADTNVAMVTFGGKQSYKMRKGRVFSAGSVYTTNPTFTVFQNGLNLYVMETVAIPPEVLDQPQITEIPFEI